MTKFLYFTSGVTYRVLVNDDGSIGSPEILRKWTSETYAPKKKAVTKQTATIKFVEEEDENLW